MDESGTDVVELEHETKNSVQVHECVIYYLSLYSNRMKRFMAYLKDAQKKEAKKSEGIFEIRDVWYWENMCMIVKQSKPLEYKIQKYQCMENPRKEIFVNIGMYEAYQ